MPRQFSLATLSEDRLLQLRLKDLKVSLEGTWVEQCVADLNTELEERNIRIRPHVWLSSEWFSPVNSPGIAIPFYLVDPRLMRLERKKILDVEGGTVVNCMRILRHEMGHVIQHAYQLQRRRRWQQLFGLASMRYPTHYRPNPASRNYVQHLRLWYAQSHPDEDFAETFAVWMKPRSDWRKRYAGWGALKKLEYVDELMAEIAECKPVLKKRIKVDPLHTLTDTLQEHYRKKQAFYAVNTPKTYDRDLRRIFSDDSGHRGAMSASAFIRKYRKEFREIVSDWTGEYQLTIDSVLDGMIERCRRLNLRAIGSERQLRMDFAVLLTARTVHLLYGPARRQWFAL